MKKRWLTLYLLISAIILIPFSRHHEDAKKTLPMVANAIEKPVRING